MERGTRGRTGREDRHRTHRRALEGDPLPARGLPVARRDRHPAQGLGPDRDADQAAVHPVPGQAGQEDGVRRRPAEAPRLRLREGTVMTTTDSTPLVVPDFGDEATQGRKLAIICSKGNLDMAY